MNKVAEAEQVCGDLNAGIERLRGEGLRLDVIYPADAPHTALMSGAGRRIRLTTEPGADRPNGALPPFEPEFLLTRAGASPGEGRAGMLYRDLIPGRLGGRYIASHIVIPEPGEVDDWVHYHKITLQLIHVRRGWVRLAYEDQGEPFVMEAGDLVLQPPEIRHRVFGSSGGLEVVEISCPAVHETYADHELALPNGREPGRLVGGQRFLHHKARAPWTPFGGGQAQETALFQHTGGIAEARVLKGENLAIRPHDGELVFGFVLDGSASLDYGAGFPLSPADSFVIPPGKAWRLRGGTSDFRLLHVATARL